jgi:chromate transporter
VSLLDIIILFGRLGAVSFGGGGASVLPELQHELVVRAGAVTERQFLNAYALGQATPGPGILWLVPLGSYIAGAPGAVAALVSFIAPPLLLQVFVAAQWERLSRSPWTRALDRSLVPISVGLIGGSVFALGSPLLPVPAHAAGAALAALISLRWRISPAVFVLGAGALGILGVL